MNLTPARLDHMRPGLFQDDSPNSLLADSIDHPKRALGDAAGGIPLSDLSDSIGRQFCARDLLTTDYSIGVRVRATALTKTAPPPLAHSAHVTGVRIQHEVRRPNTPPGAVVAQVGDLRQIWGRHLASSQEVRKDMGATGTAVDSEGTIAVNVTGCSPNPTRPKFRAVRRSRTVLVDLRPETLSERLFLAARRRVPTLWRAVQRNLTQVPDCAFKNGVASDALKGSRGTLLGHRLSPSGGVLPARHRANDVGLSCVNYTNLLRVEAL